LGLRWRVNILWGKNSTTWQHGSKKELYSGKVYCVTVPTGMILVRHKERISVVGNCDTIRAHQYGIENAVAMCGLKISEKQLKLLHGAKNFYIVVEDIKGEEALDRLYEQIISHDFYANVKIINLRTNGEKCDLDEFLLKYGKGEFLNRIKNAHTYSEYKLIDSISKITYKSIEEKKKHIYLNKKYILGIKSLIDRNQYIELLAKKLELPENDIRRIISRADAQDRLVEVPYDEKIDNRVHVSQSYIIATFFANNFTISEIYEQMKELKVKNKLKKEFKKIFEKICDTVLTYGNKCDIINILHTENILNKDELLILDEAFFRHDDLDYLEDKYELNEFLKDQLDNLR
jgi:DNA primase